MEKCSGLLLDFAKAKEMSAKELGSRQRQPTRTTTLQLTTRPETSLQSEQEVVKLQNKLEIYKQALQEVV